MTHIKTEEESGHMMGEGSQRRSFTVLSLLLAVQFRVRCFVRIFN